MNIGEGEMDISGYEIRDNSDDHRWKFPEGSIIKAGELLLVKDNSVGQIYNEGGSYSEGAFQEAIGIGSGDSIRIYDREENLLDEYSWTGHASYEGKESEASYGRYPDGTGAFTLMPETPGKKNDWYKPQIVLNEIESNGDATDWVEIYNAGTTKVDISGWYILDNDPEKHAADVTPLAEGTVLEPGAYYVFEEKVDFGFGLGKGDQVSLFNKEGVLIEQYGWTEHAAGVLARIPDGIGEFVDFETATKGVANVINNPVVLNEIQSNDPDGGADWIELANPTDEELDISGIVIKDNDDTHEYRIPDGTTISANGFLVIKDFGFGLGKGDSVRLYEDGVQIEETTWEGHTAPTWGLYPDVNGKEYRNTLEATPGAANIFDGIPDVIEWPGSGEVKIYDNGTGKFWIMDVAADGTLSFANGFANGKRVRFQKDAGNPAAAGPDVEGITAAGDGCVYFAAERDNSNKGANYNTILKVDPKKEGTDLVALQEWNLTDLLPQVAANTGIEAVEWISNSDIEGKLYDQNTNAAFDSGAYPDAVAGGVFFVALEDNGHVYAFVLNNDGSAVQIADIDSKLGGAMALDYDTYEKALWVAADNGFNNLAAKITFTGEAAPEIVHVKPAAGLDAARNYEGFAIAEAEYTVNGQRPVYHFEDGVKSGALAIGSINCDYKGTEIDDGEEEKPGEGGSIGGEEKPGEGGSTSGEDKPGEISNNDDKNGGMTGGSSNGNNSGNTSNVSTPKTGDVGYFEMIIALIGAAGSLICIGVVLYRRKLR